MIPRDPLGAPASLAADTARRLERVIAAADGDWADVARRDFDRKHLDRIRAGASGLSTGMDDLADRCRWVAAQLDDG